jgi:4-hydroxythreonine-4-phosphate dehydrogenase
MSSKKIIGITLGDPAGIGPEITVKSLSTPTFYDACNPFVIGDSSVLEAAIKILGKDLKVNVISDIDEALFTFGTIDIYDMNLIDINKLKRGEVSAMAGNAAFEYVKKAIALAMDGTIDATVTNALNKEALNLAGHHYSGHTEIYAEFTGTKKYTMLLVHDTLRVVHVSTHVSLRNACDLVKKERVLEVIRIANQACKDFGIAQPKIGVAGLNPHCGENGLFGTEEIEEIAPAIATAKAEGIIIDGPIPPDSIFSKANGGWYDVVVAMYHDQGHIPLKVLGFVYDREAQSWQSISGVNITLGLPIIRASVDHGTAFDQAGLGIADETSLNNAIDYAILMAQNR